MILVILSFSHLSKYEQILWARHSAEHWENKGDPHQPSTLQLMGNVRGMCVEKKKKNHLIVAKEVLSEQRTL